MRNGADNTVEKFPEFGRILHPTDLSTWDEVAFAHALKIAWKARSEFNLVHVSTSPSEVGWGAFPHVRDLLVRWRELPSGASHAAVVRAGLRVFKVKAKGSDVERAVRHHLEDNPADFAVVLTHQYTGAERLMHRSVAEPLARHAAVATLFVPVGQQGFVRLEDGAVTLRRVLVPVDWSPDPRPALHMAQRLVSLLGRGGDVEFHLLHIRHGALSLPLENIALPGVALRRSVVEGNVVEQILATARSEASDLIAMATAGHEGFLDALRGSTTERVLRGAMCPVLATPPGVARP